MCPQLAQLEFYCDGKALWKMDQGAPRHRIGCRQGAEPLGANPDKAAKNLRITAGLDAGQLANGIECRWQACMQQRTGG